MIGKLFRRRSPEVRESYTDLVVNRLISAASGVGDGSSGLAAIETAARLWGAGLASATVKPSNIALDGVTPTVLDSIGRSLCRSGESVHIIDIRNGRVMLTPTASWSIRGDSDPASWIYLCNMNGPSTARTITREAASILHVKYAPSPNRPWAGRSPMILAIDTARAAGLLEKATSEELNFTQSQLLTPRRSAGDYGMADTLNPEAIQKIVDAFAEHVHTGAFVLPSDVVPQRLGPEPPDSFPLIRDRLENSILSMCGIPPALVAARGTGTAMREAFRQVLHSFLKPLGAILADELREKLHPAAELDFSALRAGDISGTSRALGSLVKAGITPKSAAAIVGLDDVEVSA